MFEVRKDESTNRTVRMPVTLINKLEEIAAAADISFNKLVVQCCEYAITHMKPISNDKDAREHNEGANGPD